MSKENEEHVNVDKEEVSKTRETKLVEYICLNCGATIIAIDEQTAKTLRLLHRCR